MNTIIIGAGGHSRVVYDILRYDNNVNVISFIDNSPRGSDEKIMGVPVTGDHDVIPSIVEDHDIDSFIVAVGDNEVRRNYFEEFSGRGLEPVSAIHPNAHISETVNIGAGSVIASGANISTNVKIGENAIINTGTIIDHESDVGSNAHVGPGTTVAGRVSIGDGAFIGMGCSVKEYTTVGEESTVGAGSVVLEDVKTGQTVAGAPAEIKKRSN